MYIVAPKLTFDVQYGMITELKWILLDALYNKMYVKGNKTVCAKNYVKSSRARYDLCWIGYNFLHDKVSNE